MATTETYTPETLDEVAALLLAADEQPRPLARGTSLITQAKGELAPIIVELTRVPELNRLEYEERDGLFIGAALPLGAALDFSPVRDAYGILADGARLARPGKVWERATLAESLGCEPPAADLLLPLVCLGAMVAIFGPHGWSEIAIEALCARGEGARLQSGEFIVGIRLPPASPRSGGSYRRSTSEGGQENAMGVGAFLLMQEDLDTCCGARITMWLAPQLSLRALDAERFLRAKRLDDDVVQQAGDLVAEAARPHFGQPESAQELWQGLQGLARQAIQRAYERARVYMGT